jgi:hypothetical protein
MREGQGSTRQRSSRLWTERSGPEGERSENDGERVTSVNAQFEDKISKLFPHVRPTQKGTL